MPAAWRPVRLLWPGTLERVKALFYVRLPDVKGTAGTAAIFIDEVLRPGPVFDWTLCHLVEVADPDALFRAVPMTIDETGSAADAPPR